MLAIALTITVALFQYEAYDSYFKARYSYLNAGLNPCNQIDYDDIDYIMIPFAAILIIIFIFLYKRRSFCVKKFKFRNIGLPMVISLFNKTDRSKTALVYARIAFEVFLLIQGITQGTKQLPSIALPVGVTDPTVSIKNYK